MAVRFFAMSSAELRTTLQKIYEDTLLPLNQKVNGPLEKTTQQIPAMPIVFMLGNHSSGKSTFINYITGQ